MNKFDLMDGKDLGKQEQGTKDPMSFIKNNHTRSVGKKNVVHDMKQLGAKIYEKQVKYNTPIKFKSTQDRKHAPQAKAKVAPIKSNKKPKPHASQDNFYADYVLT
jgi:hypothetical protein